MTKSEQRMKRLAQQSHIRVDARVLDQSGVLAEALAAGAAGGGASRPWMI